MAQQFVRKGENKQLCVIQCNTRQTSNGIPPRRIKDSIWNIDPEQMKREKKKVGERGSYEQKKEKNQESSKV